MSIGSVTQNANEYQQPTESSYVTTTPQEYGSSTSTQEYDTTPKTKGNALELLPEELFRILYAQADKNGDGIIDAKEFKELLKAVFQILTQGETIDGVIDHDKNNDGIVTEAEALESLALTVGISPEELSLLLVLCHYLILG